MKSGSEYKIMFENTPLCYQILDVNGNIIQVNRAWLKLFGYKKEEVIGTWFGNYIKASQVDVFRKLFQLNLDLGKIHSEFDFICENGKEVSITYEGAISSNPTDNKDYVHCILVDITEQKLILADRLDTQERLKKANNELSQSLSQITKINQELLEAKRKAEENELLYKSLVESSESVIALIDFNGNFLFINKIGAADLNLKPEEMIGGNMSQFFPSKIAQKQLKQIQQVINKGEIIVEESLTVLNGVSKWYHTCIYPIKNAEGSVTSALLNTTDITDRKLAMDALEKKVDTLTQTNTQFSDIKFEDLFNLEEIQKIQDAFAYATHVASLITKPDGTPITKPSNFCRLCKDIIRKSEIGQERCHFSDSVIGKGSKDGKFYQHCLSTGLWDGGAQITIGGIHIANWLIGQVKDPYANEMEMANYADVIGVNKQEFIEALKEVSVMTESEFEQVTNALRVLANELSTKAFQIVQQARYIAQINKAKSELQESEDRNNALIHAIPDLMFILSREGIFLDYITRNEKVLLMSPEAFLNKNLLDVLPRKIGVRSIQHLRKLFRTGKLQSYEYELQIKNETRYFENRLVKLGTNKALSLIRDITANKKTEIELIKAKVKAEESDKLKSAFLANMSHEIRTPMNAIMGFIELLSRQELPDDKREKYVDIIKNSGNQLLSLINDIIDISKIETNQITVRNSLVNINALVIGLIDFFGPIASKKGIALNIYNTLPNPSISIQTDEVKLNQILTNLISNAIKFTNVGFVKVGFTVENENVEFIVKDSGIGIKPENTELIFDRFRQVEMGEVRNFGGAGLGLSISKAFVTMLGGNIYVKSKFGKGSTFIFTIPAKN